MQRICFILNNEFTHDNRVHREATALVNHGYQVTVMALLPKGSTLPAIETRDGVEIRRIFPEPFANYDPFQLRILKAVIRVMALGRRFDVIHAHDFNTMFPAWLLSQLMNAHFIYDSHEYWNCYFNEESKQLATNPKRLSSNALWLAKKKLAFSRWLQQHLMRSCDAVISVSDSLCNLLREDSRHSLKQVLTIRNICEFHPITAEKHSPFSFHQAFNLPKDYRIMVYQGGITEVRGIMPLLDAVEKMTFEPVVLVLMGRANRPFFQKLYDRISHSPKLREKVLFKTMVPASELIDWTRTADLGIHPILNCRTNHHICLPNKVFEYIQAEIPVALSNVPEMQNIVDTHQVGFTFNPENPAELAQNLDQFFTDSNQSGIYSENLKATKEHLCWEKEQIKLISLYDKLLKVSRPSTQVESASVDTHHYAGVT